jgi:predicted lactoylglutathione lyase
VTIYINLPSKDLAASKLFWTEAGFKLYPKFSDASAICVILEAEVAYLMLMIEDRFRDFITGTINTVGTEVINALTAERAADVDAIVDRALSAGANTWKPDTEYGDMYGRTFQDPDGHVWEVMFMGWQPA